MSGSVWASALANGKVYLIRGLPNGIPGEVTDFTLVLECRHPVAHLHIAERVDTVEKYRRIKGLLKKMGYNQAVAQRRTGIKTYPV
jgi:hypothetical protein